MRKLPYSRAGWLPMAAATLVTNISLAQSNNDAWTTGGNNWRQNYFSTLKDIDPSNVDQLGFAWQYDIDFDSMLEATPVLVDGTLYTSGSGGIVFALDPVTGKQRWKVEPKIDPKFNGEVGYGLTNRGVAVANGKVYVGAIDGWLYALNATNGAVVWKVDTINDRNRAYSITGAPYIAGKRIVVGNAGAELDARGYVTAYDLETGKQAWRFFTVPGDPKLGFENETMARAAETWNGEWWRLGGGGTVWDSMAYDPELDLLYIGTGNGSPWNRALRSPGGGDNLFLSSIVALKPDDGSYVWHYQTTPGESWDYTATQPIVVADLTLDGAERRVVMQAPKNGFFYVLDAATGELISAEPFAAVNWASGVDLQTGRPIENPAARYDVTGQPVAVQPSSAGAHNWHPMAFSPDTGLVYLSASDNALVYAPDRNFNPNLLVSNLGIDLSAGATLGPGALADLPRGAYTLAWDPIAKRAAWRIDGPSAGMLATAGGLIFRGAGNRLVASSAADGRELWSSQDVHTGIVAGPISFELDGVQHVAVVAGRATGNYYAPDYSRLLVFRRGANVALPPEEPFTPPPLNPPPSVASADEIARGRDLYEANCALCHDVPGNAGGLFRRGLFPDLAFSPALASREAFAAVVLDGARAANGMAAYAGVLDADEADAIRAHIVDRANAVLAARGGAGR